MHISVIPYFLIFVFVIFVDIQLLNFIILIMSLLFRFDINTCSEKKKNYKSEWKSCNVYIRHDMASQKLHIQH